MRVVEPNKNTEVEQHRSKHARCSKKLLLLFAFTITIVFGLWLGYMRANDVEAPTLQLVEEQSSETKENFEELNPGQATGDEKYQSLWYSLTIPDTIIPAVAPDINGDTEFSRLVSSIAESRGYQLQKVYSGDNLSSFRGVVLASDVVNSLTELVNQAMDEGLELSISSGYRTLEEQEAIFIGRYNAQRGEGLGVGDAIGSVLDSAAPPGYSKHHSAYTIDMTCNGLGAQNFIGTVCDEWLSANDYEIARNYGFIPSYPKNIDVQGPIPEPWEYNYVGTAVLEDINLL